MKRKPAPVLLIVLGLIVVIGLGLTNGTDIWQKIFTPPPPKPKVDDSTKQDVTKYVEADIEKHKRSNDVTGSSGAASGIPDKPTIFQAKFKRYDPAPNESATSSLWYDKEHEQQGRKKDLAEKKNY